MNYSTFLTLLDTARAVSDPDQFLGELGWMPWMDAYGEDHADDIAAVAALIYRLANAEGFAGIRAICCESQGGFAKAYRIPIRTIQNRECRRPDADGYQFDFIRYAVFSNLTVGRDAE